jgi:radical SAM protein with 4Fe4S-binding SPASM domain
MELSLYTSGVDDRFSGVVSLLEDIGDSRVILSLYSYRPKVHDTVTLCQGSHAMTVEAIQEAVRAGVHTELHFTAMRENYGDLIGLCKLAAELGVQRVSVLRLVPQGRSDVNTSDIFLSHEDNMHLRELIKEGRSVVNLRVGSPYGFLHISDSPQCSAGVDRLIVLPDLTISPCDAFKQISSVNMTGTDEFSRLDRWCLSECWEKSPYLQAVRDHLREVHAAPCCVCANLAECFSGCTAQRYIANGRLVRGPDPECIVDGSGARGRGIR